MNSDQTIHFAGHLIALINGRLFIDGDDYTQTFAYTGFKDPVHFAKEWILTSELKS